MAASRARLAVVVVALAIAVATWLAGDGGGARAAVGQATGPLVAAAPDNTALLVAGRLKPGDARVGEVTVTNAGDASGGFVLAASDLVDSGAGLSGVLELVVDDVTAGRAVYSGPLSGLVSVPLGTLAQGERHRYRFAVSFPGGRQDSVDNAYQGASTTVTFAWTATGGAATGAPPASDQASGAAPVVAAAPGRIPRIAVSAARRQGGGHGKVSTSVRCEASCRIVVDGSASFASRKLRLRAVRRTLAAPGRVQMRLTLPRAARVAVARGRRVTVRLRAKATLGGRVVTTRRTVIVTRRR